MKELLRLYGDKVTIKKVNDELMKYQIVCNDNYILSGTCLCGKYDDDLFTNTINTKSMYCYNLREVKSVLTTLKEV